MKLEPVAVSFGNPKSCHILLPGRGQEGSTLLQLWSKYHHTDVTLISLTPENLQWYPRPNGPNDQTNALAGLEEARNSVYEKIDAIKRHEKLHSNKDFTEKDIVLVGFSAGGVTAIQAGVHKQLFKGIVCCSGAILDPDSIPESISFMPIVLVHGTQDDVFLWDERYVPMKNALISKNYNVKTIESDHAHKLHLNGIAESINLCEGR